MGFGGGGGSDTVTQKTEIPAWLRPYVERALQREEQSAAKADEIAAGMEGWRPNPWSAEEQYAMDMIGALPSQLAGYDQAARGYLAQGTDIMQGMLPLLQGMTPEQRAKFEDPYTESVINSTIRNMEEQNTRQRMMDEARAAAVGGTTGSRRAVADILRERELTRAVGDYANKARSEAFRWATDTGMKDLQQQYEMGSGLAGKMMDYAGTTDRLASSLTGRTGTIAEYLSGQGAKRRENFNTRDRWPLELQNWYKAQVTSGTGGLAAGSGTTTKDVPKQDNTFSNLLGIGLTAASFLSDERLKDDVRAETDEALEKIRKITPARYRYKGHPREVVGFVAQDVEQALPEAVGNHPSGYKTVDLVPLVSTTMKAVQELDEKLDRLAEPRRLKVAQGGL